MRKQKVHFIATLMMMTLLLSLGAGSAFAAGGTVPMTPELASKTENVRKQKEQRITPAQRQAAADALKAQREKVIQIKKAAQPAAPATLDITPNK